MMDSNKDIGKLSKSKQIEVQYIYPKLKWFYARFYSLSGFYWAYKLICGNYEFPNWEQWALWLFAMLSLYFFSREEGLDGFYDELN